MEDYTLIAVPGITDPIRGGFDGPILHIVRHYTPKNVVLLLSEEIAKTELVYHHNEEAIRLLNPECLVEVVNTGIKNVFSYDDFSLILLHMCKNYQKKYPNNRIILNISSGTPQMNTAFCMIVLANPERYLAVQVLNPENSSTKTVPFDPQKELIEEVFENNCDNLEGAPNRCRETSLLNFRRPMVQFQIESLIHNYDYAGAYQLYMENASVFDDEVGMLLLHAQKRLNLEYEEAEKIARDNNKKDELYLNKRADISELVDYFNSMKVMQFRGELNDFALRIEIMLVYLGKYVLEKCMHINIEDITTKRITKIGSIQYFTSKEKCENKVPGISEYLDKIFVETRSAGFEWGKPLNGLFSIYVVSFLSKGEIFKKYEESAKEMLSWATSSGNLRNPAAHSIISITDKNFREAFGKTSAKLCNAMYAVLRRVFGSEVVLESFDIFDRINVMIETALEK